jgi:hypothetical protein
MKVQILTFAFLATLTASAQRGWQLGFEINPGYYTMLNDADKMADPIIIAFDNPELLSAPRAWAVGAKAFYGFTDNIGLQTGLRYSWARQDYTHGRGDLPGGGTEIGTISTELNYLQVPLLFSWNAESKSGTRFYVSVGLAPAWQFWYYENNSKTVNSSNLSTSRTVTSTSTFRGVSRQNIVNGIKDSYNEKVFWDRADGMYKDINLFFAAEAGLLVPLNKGWHFNLALTYYQSLISPDNIESWKWEDDKYTRNEIPPTDSQIDNPTKFDRPKTTLMTIGISLGLLYEFDW